MCIIACECNLEGSEMQTCDSQDKCKCKTGVSGEKCDECEEDGFYGFPQCSKSKELKIHYSEYLGLCSSW